MAKVRKSKSEVMALVARLTRKGMKIVSESSENGILTISLRDKTKEINLELTANSWLAIKVGSSNKEIG